jgi:GT2 family glycosyltransferase/glycosyltransferase involved in cell wall biosynthesis
MANRSIARPKRRVREMLGADPAPAAKPAAGAAQHVDAQTVDADTVDAEIGATPTNVGPALAAVLAFEGTDALVHLSRPADVAAIRLDGHDLPPHRWRRTEADTLRVACPPSAFDTTRHTLCLCWAAAEFTPPLELTFRSDYRHTLERVDDMRVSGWIYDLLRPASLLTLEVAGEFWPAFTLLNALKHPALAGHTPKVSGGGFEIALPPRPANARPEVVSITVRGTSHQPFGPILRGTTLSAAIGTAAAAARSFGRTAHGLLAAGVLLPAVVQALSGKPPSVDDLLLDGGRRLPGTQGLPRGAPPRVDIVVPAYRGVAETLACLHGVLGSGDSVAHRVIVIDDCSPEAELSAALRALAAESGATYLRNETNLGFVATANRGMAESDSDVLLLNSDTVVPRGFLDRLYRAAYSDPAIATVTPLSNNATICSLPLPPGTEGAPYGLDTSAIDAICREVNAGTVRDIPTAHGFCMFIKRAAIDDVGPFDAVQFGAGYGEENDFSLRVFERGWRNVAACDVYVHHLGAVSFAAAREARIAANLGKVEALYPYYHHFVADFLRTDPLHDARNRVQKAAWRRLGRSVLFVTLALEGGAVRHADDMMRRLTEEGYLALALSMGRDHDQRPMLTLRRWASGEALRYPHPARVTEALADVLDLSPQFIHVQHLLDLPDGVGEFIRDCGIPYAVTLHDFFYACPKVTLIDEGGGYCGMPPVAKCTACVRHGPIHPNIHPSLGRHARVGETWRGKWDSLLRDATQVIAPSRDTASRYAALFPGLTATVRPHFGVPSTLVPQPRPAVGTRLRVAVPGAVGPQKGARQLVDLARHCSRWEDDLHFVVVGHSDRDKELERYGNVEVTGSYQPGDAAAALLESGCRVALFLSVFPETYSYTLSESLAAGLIPVAYDFGALGERLRALGTGVLVPLNADPAHIVAAIRQATGMTQAVPPAACYGQYERLLADYYEPALVDLAESVPPPDMPRLLAWPAGMHRDRWCGAETSLQVWAPRPIVRLALSFWVPEQVAMQAIEIVWNGHVLARQFLDEARVTRIECAIPARDMRFLDVACRCDFIYPLQAPDLRSCAVMFAGIELSTGGNWQSVELPQPPGRAPQAGDGRR